MSYEPMRLSFLAAISTASWAAAAPQTIPEPSADRWMYPSNGTPGFRAQASTFSALPSSGGVEDRWGFFLIQFDTSAHVPAGLPPSHYRIRSIHLTATTGQDETFDYDPTPDPLASYGTPDADATVTDPDAGRPVELHGAGFRNGFNAGNFLETSAYGTSERNAYPLGFGPNGNARDVSWNVTAGFEAVPWATGTTTEVEPGDPVPLETVFTFDIDSSLPGVNSYLQQGLSEGSLWFSLSSLHPAIQQGGQLAAWLTRDDALHQIFGDLAPTLTFEVELNVPIKLSRRGTENTLTWPTFEGFDHELQASSNLEDWAPIPQGDGTATESTSATRRFYRIQILPTTP